MEVVGDSAIGCCSKSWVKNSCPAVWATDGKKIAFGWFEGWRYTTQMGRGSPLENNAGPRKIALLESCAIQLDRWQRDAVDDGGEWDI